MEGCRRGFTGRLVQYAVKMYRGHRMLPNFAVAEVQLDFGNYAEAIRAKKLTKRF
jgi:hypothetical protein